MPVDDQRAQHYIEAVLDRQQCVQLRLDVVVAAGLRAEQQDLFDRETLAEETRGFLDRAIG